MMVILVLVIVWVLFALGAGHFIAAGMHDEYGKSRKGFHLSK